MRDKHQKTDGYAVGVSRVIAAAVSTVYDAWQKDKTRSRWLPDTPITNI